MAFPRLWLSVGTPERERRERKVCLDSLRPREGISGLRSLDLFSGCEVVKSLNKPLVADMKSGAQVSNGKRGGRCGKEFKDASG